MNQLRWIGCLCLYVLQTIFLTVSAGNSIRFTNIFPAGTSAICSFAQDTTGLIWFGTGNGLYSFDGYRAIPCTDGQNTPAPRIHALCPSTGGILYLGTDHGMQTYNTRTGTYTLPRKGSPQDIRALLKDGDLLWVGALSGLFSYHLKNGTFTRYTSVRQPVYALVKTPAGVFAGTYRGLFCLSGRSVRKVPVGNGETFVNSLLWDNRRQSLWIGTSHNFYQYSLQNGTCKEVPGFSGISIKALSAGAGGRLWIGTDTGLYQYTPGKKALALTHDSQNPHSLTNNIVWALFTDKWQNTWVGTDNGVSLLEQSSYARFIPIADITGIGEGNTFHALFQDSRGFLWAGGTNGLIRTRPQGNGFTETAWFKPGGRLHPFSNNRVRQIYEDRDGGLWVTTDGGLNYYDYASGQFRHFLVTDKSQRYSCQWAYDIVEDRNHRLWIAAYMGGIFIIDKQKLLNSGGRCTADIHIGNTPGKLPDIHVNRLAQDRDGNIWAFQYNNFLVWINYRTLQVKSLSIPADRHISNVIADRYGHIWVRCESSVLKYTSPARKPEEYFLFSNRQQGHMENFCDVNGTVWAFSGQDCRILDKDILSIHLNNPTGIVTSAYYAAGTGKVLLGVNDGLWELDPRQKPYDTRDFSLFRLSSVEVNGKPLSAVQWNGGKTLVLKNDENNLTFNFTDLPYKDTPSSPFLYCMEGVSDNWLPVISEDKKIAFNSLPYGTYHLRICMEKAGGQPGKTVCSLKIRILPPWYLSLPACLIYLLFAGGLIWWGINFYVMRKRLKIEKLARRRISEQSQAKLDFYTHLSHDLKTPLSLIMGPVAHLLTTVHDNATHTELETIQRNSTKLNRLIHQALDINKLDDSRETSLFLSRTEVIGFSRRILDNFRTAALEKQISLSFHTDTDTLYTDIDIIKWESVFNNLLSNALKYTPVKGQISMTVSKDPSQHRIIVSVSDTGIGIPPEDIPYIFQRFFQSRQTQGRIEGTGIGLYIVKKYTELMQGTVTLTSELHKGSTFRLSFPLTETPEKTPAHNPDNPESPHHAKTTPLILVVEDNLDMGQFIDQILSPSYRILRAGDGKEGLDMYHLHHPDLIITDLMMPVMDGMEMSRQIRNGDTDKQPLILMLTAKTDTGTQAEGIRTRIDLFLPKPFDPQLLLLHVGKLFEARKEAQTRALAQLATEPKEDTAEGYDEQLLARITRLTEDHLSETDFNVNKLAALTGVSEKTITRKLKQFTGMTGVEYIRSIRVKKAAMYLSQGKFTVTEVMYMAGFSNGSYFSKCFQKAFGCTPKEYIRKTTN